MNFEKILKNDFMADNTNLWIIDQVNTNNYTFSYKEYYLILTHNTMSEEFYLELV